MVVITTPNFLKALDTLNNLVPMGTNEMTERQLRPLTNLEPEIHLFIQSFEVINNIRQIGRIPENLEQTKYLAQLDSDLQGYVWGNIINTFDEYLQSRWNISNVQGYRLINSANVILNLKSPQLGNFQQMKIKQDIYLN